MDLIESLFMSIGEPDPWGSIINPIWAAILVNVEEAWDRATDHYPIHVVPFLVTLLALVAFYCRFATKS